MRLHCTLVMIGIGKVQGTYTSVSRPAKHRGERGLWLVFGSFRGPGTAPNRRSVSVRALERLVPALDQAFFIEGLGALQLPEHAGGPLGLIDRLPFWLRHARSGSQQLDRADQVFGGERAQRGSANKLDLYQIKCKSNILPDRLLGNRLHGFGVNDEAAKQRICQQRKQLTSLGIAALTPIDIFAGNLEPILD